MKEVHTDYYSTDILEFRHPLEMQNEIQLQTLSIGASFYFRSYFLFITHRSRRNKNVQNSWSLQYMKPHKDMHSCLLLAIKEIISNNILISYPSNRVSETWHYRWIFWNNWIQHLHRTFIVGGSKDWCGLLYYYLGSLTWVTYTLNSDEVKNTLNKHELKHN